MLNNEEIAGENDIGTADSQVKDSGKREKSTVDGDKDQGKKEKSLLQKIRAIEVRKKERSAKADEKKIVAGGDEQDKYPGRKGHNE
jgi:uncharacterized protein with WD repeat